MKKKKLKAYQPIAVLKRLPEGERNYIVNAGTFERLFCLDVYLRRDGGLLFTVFCDVENRDWITWDWKKSRFLTCMVSNLPDVYGVVSWYYDHGDYDLLSEELLGIAQDYFPGSRDIAERIFDWQGGIHKQNAEEKYRKEQKAIEEKFSACKQLPKGVTRWLRDELMKDCHLMYYKKVSKTQYRGWCSHCEQTVEGRCENGKLLDTQGVCPKCGARITFKSPDKSAETSFWKAFCTVEKDFERENLIVSRWLAGYSYRKGKFTPYSGQVDRSTELMMRAIISPSGIIQRWEKAEIRVAGASREGWRISLNPIRGKVYPSSVKKAFTGIWNHCAFQFIPENIIQVSGVDNVISLSCVYPILESLAKAGYNHLLKDLLPDSCGIRLLTGSEMLEPGNVREIHRALHLSRHGARVLRKIDGGRTELRYIRSVEKSFGRAVTDYEMREFCKIPNPRTVIEISAQVKDMNRWFDYAYRVCEDRQIGVSQFTMDYDDHLRDLRTLGLSGSKYFFPKDFAEVHFRLSEEAQNLRDEDKTKHIKTVAEMMAPVYEGSDGVYVTMLPRSSGALRVEGRKMHHCVGGYSDKMARGDCVIVFIRRAEDPETPFVTAEFDQFGNCVQVRGKCNSRPDDNTMAWFEDYKKIVKKKLEEQKREQIKRKNRRRDRRGDQSDQTADGTESVVCVGGDRQTADRSQGNGAPRRMGAVAV